MPEHIPGARMALSGSFSGLVSIACVALVLGACFEDAADADEAGDSSGGPIIIVPTLGDDEGSSSSGTTTPDPDTGSSEGSSGDEPGGEARCVHTEIDGVESLAGGYHYEVWAIIAGAPVTVGKFNVDASQTIVGLDGIAIPDAIFNAGRDLTGATIAVITIEQPGDVDIIPGTSHYAAGPFAREVAVLDPFHDDALGMDGDELAGGYVLESPTNGADTDERSGAWFLDVAVVPAQPGLQIPLLPPGWMYEGWAIVDGMPLSMGRFSFPDQPDLAAPYSGAEAGPPVPGEDFLVNAPATLAFPLDLAGAQIVVTIEPEPDPAPEPFTFKPLSAQVIENAATNHTFDLDNNTDTFPTLTLTLVRDGDGCG